MLNTTELRESLQRSHLFTEIDLQPYYEQKILELCDEIDYLQSTLSAVEKDMEELMNDTMDIADHTHCYKIADRAWTRMTK